ncbi:unnamed protein product [Protopolystoma xenopodis]|uniref:Uncharacterized protein n=1 Tax=Protopolystoma xenopodis TaxID=117903 RepID=A0A448WVW5_9PLAT|nr:unnamed protein product [Protopolystoma xenopodis]
MSAMDVDDVTPSTVSVAQKKRFEIKKWNAVALWAWDIVVDNCAICRNHIMDLCNVQPELIIIIRYRMPSKPRFCHK